MTTALITGANRSLSLEFTKKFLKIRLAFFEKVNKSYNGEFFNFESEATSWSKLKDNY